MDAKSSELSGADLVARARDLVPALRQRAGAAEQAGRIPDESIQDCIDAGIFRAAVPKRFGGHEVDYRYIPQIIRELGRGCTSTSWVIGFLFYHNFQHGHFPEQAQQEMFGGEKGFTMSPGQIVSLGKADPVEGGYKLTGMWPYASGVHHGDYMLMSAPVTGSDPAEVRRFIVPITEIKILDTWHVSAMAATGSHNVEVEGVFVPAHRSVNVVDFRENRGPGLEHNTGPLWQVPVITYLTYGALGVLVGGAEAIVEIVADILKDKVGAYSGAKLQQQMTSRVRLANNVMRLAATRALFDEKIGEVAERAAAGVAVTREQRLECRMVSSYIAQECYHIVMDVGQDGGSRSKFIDSPIQRFQRDIGSLATHALFETDSIGDQYGGTLMGQEVPPGAMI